MSTYPEWLRAQIAHLDRIHRLLTARGTDTRGAWGKRAGELDRLGRYARRRVAEARKKGEL